MTRLRDCNTKMLVLQDGVRIGAPAGELVPVSINFPLYMARQVEVMLTPGSALYGADAVSGVINIITRDPGSQVGQKQTLLPGAVRLILALPTSRVA